MTPAWVNKELQTELRHKPEVNKKWKQGQMIQGDYRVVVWLCRNGVRKAKAGMELNLGRDVKGNKKQFYHT